MGRQSGGSLKVLRRAFPWHRNADVFSEAQNQRICKERSVTEDGVRMKYRARIGVVFSAHRSIVGVPMNQMGGETNAEELVYLLEPVEILGSKYGVEYCSDVSVHGGEALMVISLDYSAFQTFLRIDGYEVGI